MNSKNKAIYKELEKLDKKLEKIENSSTSRTLKGFKRDLADMRDLLNKLYREYEVDGNFDYGRFKKLKDQNMLNDYVAATVINRFINVEKETRATLTRITDETINSLRNLKEVPGIESISRDFDVEKVVNNQMAGVHWTQRYGVRRDQAIKDIQVTIKEGLKSGDSYTSMSKKLGEKIAGEAYQVDRVVRTEAHRCMNETKLETFREINQEFPVYKKWISSSDERTRSAHQALDGTIIPVDEDFHSLTGSSGPGPGQMGSPEDDCNCRCWLTLEIRKDK